MKSTISIIAFILATTVVEGRNLLDQLSLVSKGTYIVYGNARRSERDLPVCESAHEACNLAHARLWFTPITERLCRCRRRAECPLSYESGNPSNSQHVSNRAQLKFCEELDESIEMCDTGQPALEMKIETRKESPPSEGGLTRSILYCRCPWPNLFSLNQTIMDPANGRTQTLIYTCDKLPKCQSGETCGHVRKDTYEVYYTCSCPTDHLCGYKDLFKSSTQTVQELQLPYFNGESYEAICKYNNML